MCKSDRFSGLPQYTCYFGCQITNYVPESSSSLHNAQEIIWSTGKSVQLAENLFMLLHYLYKPDNSCHMHCNVAVNPHINPKTYS